MLFAGPPLPITDSLRLVPPRLQELARADPGDHDDGGSWSRWRERAPDDESIVYYAIELDDRLVGEIFLHDISDEAREAMVGYRVFEVTLRRTGVATGALQALIDLSRMTGRFDRLVAIAREDNIASCGLLQRCGFMPLGRAREDHRRIVHELRLN